MLRVMASWGERGGEGGVGPSGIARTRRVGEAAKTRRECSARGAQHPRALALPSTPKTVESQAQSPLQFHTREQFRQSYVRAYAHATGRQVDTQTRTAKCTPPGRVVLLLFRVAARQMMSSYISFPESPHLRWRLRRYTSRGVTPSSTGARLEGGDHSSGAAPYKKCSQFKQKLAAV